MPIIEVEIIGDVAPETRRGMAARIANGVADVLRSEPQSVWVRLRSTRLSDYAENGAARAGGTPASGTPDAASPQWPVFVKLVKRASPSPAEMREEVRALTTAIGTACGRPADSVHIFYEPPGAGRMAFGGRLVE